MENGKWKREAVGLLRRERRGSSAKDHLRLRMLNERDDSSRSRRQAGFRIDLMVELAGRRAGAIRPTTSSARVTAA
jgi:hypothetical protein